jgi:predicted transcriptional regulator
MESIARTPMKKYPPWKWKEKPGALIIFIGNNAPVSKPLILQHMETEYGIKKSTVDDHIHRLKKAGIIEHIQRPKRGWRWVRKIRTIEAIVRDYPKILPVLPLLQECRQLVPNLIKSFNSKLTKKGFRQLTDLERVALFLALKFSNEMLRIVIEDTDYASLLKKERDLTIMGIRSAIKKDTSSRITKGFCARALAEPLGHPWFSIAKRCTTTSGSLYFLSDSDHTKYETIEKLDKMFDEMEDRLTRRRFYLDKQYRRNAIESRRESRRKIEMNARADLLPTVEGICRHIAHQLKLLGEDTEDLDVEAGIRNNLSDDIKSAKTHISDIFDCIIKRESDRELQELESKYRVQIGTQPVNEEIYKKKIDELLGKTENFLQNFIKKVESERGRAIIKIDCEHLIGSGRRILEDINRLRILNSDILQLLFTLPSNKYPI